MKYIKYLYVIAFGVLVSLLGCQKVGFERTAQERALFQSSVFDDDGPPISDDDEDPPMNDDDGPGDDDTPGDDDDGPGDDDTPGDDDDGPGDDDTPGEDDGGNYSSHIPVVLMCSNEFTTTYGTNVKRATQGITAAIYVAGNLNSPVMTVTSAAMVQKIRNEIINEKKLKLDLTSLPDGNYTMALCDAGLPKGAYCGMAKPWRGVIGSIRGEYGPVTGRFKFKVVAGVVQIPPKVGPNPIYPNEPSYPYLTPDGTLFQPMAVIYDVAPGAGGSNCDEDMSPLMIDLDRTGIALSKPLEGVYFDITATGKKHLISWPTKASTAFLVLDKNRNGQIDDAGELFGNNSVGPKGKAANGFEALKQYDVSGEREDSDGRIDHQDPIFAQLQLWIDRDFDGTTDPGELVPLSDYEIESIDLRYDTIEVEDSYGNKTRQQSLIRLKGGDIRRIVDIWFRLI